MDWVKQLNRILSYIEDHLDGEISYVEIAKLAGCSVYNFQRIFSYIANEPLSEYIRNRRLTLAAFDILNSDSRLVDIAVKYGYDSSDAFSRAFKGFHGVLPSKLRNETVSLRSCPKLSFQFVIKGETHMNYQIEQWPAFTLAGFKQRLKTEEVFQVVPALWADAWKNGRIERLTELCMRADCRPAGLVGIAAGGEWGDSEEMEYLMAVTTFVDVEGCRPTPTPEGMDEYTVRAATWAIFEANGALPDAVQKVYRQFSTEWLPNSGYVPDDLPAIECYLQNDRQEVWIAVKSGEGGRK